MSTIRTRILQSSYIAEYPKHFSAKLRPISQILPELKGWIRALLDNLIQITRAGIYLLINAQRFP